MINEKNILFLTDGSNNFEVYKHAWGEYYVSNFGNVFNSIRRKISKYKGGGDRYCRIRPRIDKKHKASVAVHRIVAKLFIPNDDPWKLFVNHKDGNKHNNHVDNLEWVTHLENMHHSATHNLHKHRIPYEIRMQILDDFYLSGCSLDELVEKYKDYDVDRKYIQGVVERPYYQKKYDEEIVASRIKRQVYKKPNYDNKFHKYSIEDANKFKKLYKKGWSYDKIGKKYGADRNTVKRYITLVS